MRIYAKCEFKLNKVQLSNRLFTCNSPVLAEGVWVQSA